MRSRTVILLSMVALAAGCGVRQRLGFGPAQPEVALPFKAELTQNAEDPRDFTVRIEDQGNGLEVTRESVRFPATAYCILSFGAAEIDWQMAGREDWAGARQGDGSTVYGGRCMGR